MDIFNRPPTISEDTLQYILYPNEEQSDRASATTLAVLMQTYADTLLPDMQWHRDSFQLKVAPRPSGKGFLLEGTMRVGDSIDDEWCAVWLLKEISAKWDVAIRVFDGDGEFLLIEAADDLPSWINPNNAENRVWIYGSHLHIVPISYVSTESGKLRLRGYPGIREENEEGFMEEDIKLLEQDAEKIVRDQSTDTQASPAIEASVWRRIAGYPARAKSHVHHAAARLPIDVAKALVVNPALIQKAVETFYTRDALQLRAAQRMARFPPEPSTEMTVKLTRTAYAQLVGQKFYPPKIFGRWDEPEDSPARKAKDIGMKIACGFEMLYQESKSRKVPADHIAPEARKDALRQNPDYQVYIRNLTSVGYFQGHVEGSQAWNSLEDKAAAAFVDARREDDAMRPTFASQVDAAIAEAGSSPSFPTTTPDADDWLNVDAESFDVMLENATKSTTADKNTSLPSDHTDHEERMASEQASKLRNLAEKVEKFVEGQGDLEGAVFSDEEQMSDSDDGSNDESDQSGDEAMNVDTPPPQDKAERQAAMEHLVPGIDPSEYGKMPASYYSNSQRVARTTIETDVRDDAPSASSAAATSKPIRPPILPRDKYDGVDSDDESDEEEEDDDEEEDEQPQVEGEVEIDMSEEQDEFLEFARQALGITDEQWVGIIKDRKDQGAFVPKNVKVNKKPQEPDNTASRPAHAHDAKTAPTTNPNLDSFETLMQAMDAELARSRQAPGPAEPASATMNKGKGKAKASEEGEEDLGDIEAAMEAELKNALEKGMGDDDEGELDDESQQAEYNLIKNFLESFKSQAGLSGPVGTLAGRLQPDWQLPRDES